MLKFFFWALLGINAVLFAFGQGYLGKFQGNEHEPARLKNQLSADRLALIPAEKAAATAASVAAPPAAERIACIELGDFSAAESRRFESALVPLDLGDTPSRLNVPSQDITSHIVFIPPQGSKEAADKKAGELKALGVTNFFIMSDNSALKWGISLGVFKSEAAAQTLLAELAKQGVHSARIAGRAASGTKLAYQFRAIDIDTKDKLTALAARFPDHEVRACK